MYKLRHPAHYLAGFLSTASAYYSPALPIATVAAFMLYEINQDWYKKDQAHKDIFEFCIGQFVAIPLFLIDKLTLNWLTS